MHEIGRIDGGRGFRTDGNVFQIGGNKFYNQKKEILMKIPELKRSRIGIVGSRFNVRKDNISSLVAEYLVGGFMRW
jgi:hypothetical protein